MNRQSLHALVRTLLIVWVSLFTVPFLFVLLVHGVPVVYSGFELSNHHSLKILYSLYKGTLWLIPTSFLLVAYYFTHPGNNRTFQG